MLYYFIWAALTFIFPFDVGLWMFFHVHIWPYLHINWYIESIRKQFGIALKRVEIANYLNFLKSYCQIIMNYGFTNYGIWWVSYLLRIQLSSVPSYPKTNLYLSPNQARHLPQLINPISIQQVISLFYHYHLFQKIKIGLVVIV